MVTLAAAVNIGGCGQRRLPSCHIHGCCFMALPITILLHERGFFVNCSHLYAELLPCLDDGLHSLVKTSTILVVGCYGEACFNSVTWQDKSVSMDCGLPICHAYFESMKYEIVGKQIV